MNERIKRKSPQEKKNPASHAKGLEYKKERDARKKLNSKNVKADILQSKNDAEFLCEDMNKCLEKYWLENKGDNSNDGEVRGITKYESETMKWGFVLEHQVCGAIITEGKPDLNGTFIKEGIASHNC